MRLFLFLALFSTLFAAKIQIEHVVLDCEIVDTVESRAKGLMGRKELPDGKGMLFVYPHAERLSFWMKNTLIPLSIGFFNDDKSLMQILDMDPPIGDTYIKYRSTSPARYALEVPQGWFEKHKIQIGYKFTFLSTVDQVE